eukprot:735412-Hanusia_phi.AAC.1
MFFAAAAAALRTLISQTCSHIPVRLPSSSLPLLSPLKPILCMLPSTAGTKSLLALRGAIVQ